jgi:PKHD-type hydroxylase
LITLRGVLSAAEALALAQRLNAEKFVDGNETAGRRAREVKRNLQLPLASPAETELNAVVVAALERNEICRSAALPTQVVPVRFARYEPGMEYGWHTDNAIMPGGAGRAVRTDLACTIFLADPTSYDGGELAVQHSLGVVRAKLGPGDAVLYPATTVHRVEPVTRGQRLVAVLWIQSMIASNEQRQLTFDLLQTIRGLESREAKAPELDHLYATYQNLLRLWSQV